MRVCECVRVHKCGCSSERQCISAVNRAFFQMLRTVHLRSAQTFREGGVEGGREGGEKRVSIDQVINQHFYFVAK